MERRGNESPMEWEFSGKPPVDHTSPFASFVTNQNQQLSTFKSPPSTTSNPTFGATTPAARSNLVNEHRDTLKPPNTSFNPQLHNKPTAPQFQNPAFTTNPQTPHTPQKQPDEPTLDPSLEASPARTDISEIPPYTPDGSFDDSFKIPSGAYTPQPAGKTLFMRAYNQLGKGSSSARQVRKRKRLRGDRDVGSVRSRLDHASDESDSDWEEGVRPGRRRSSTDKNANPGWLTSFLDTVSKYPAAPAVLSRWLQFVINMFLIGVVLFAVFSCVMAVRNDLARAADKARSNLMHEISQCTSNYHKNLCAPKLNRAPALELPCNEWEACMNQDPSTVMMTQISARNMAEILNEFFTIISYKTWGFILSAFLVAIIGTNVGFGSLRESGALRPSSPRKHAEPVPVAAPPPTPVHPIFSTPAFHNPQQAYIFAPIETPRRARPQFFDDATDTDNSPDVRMMLPPRTPRRSPSKGERRRV
ncbi:Di-sulfide bridge nucleocytoplasmic transport domain-containing protein [Sordaria brevicollis]|uniref:Di-sulfide bridge nucleocytoplasmic transport domain-containing protein n=1 Tax=Sordaria brevicollis TaxID=83679 RepID=A0AAE0U2T4_SORBR|nr:Di-sulfide bridge nucleocytoplasmic transport domain-containing protein [Sordaria brevicollis]